MKTFGEHDDEMTAMNYQNHRAAPVTMLEPTTAKYLLDFIYFTRDDEQFRFYKKVSTREIGAKIRESNGIDRLRQRSRIPCKISGQKVTKLPHKFPAR